MSRQKDIEENKTQILRNAGQVPVVAPSDYKSDGTWTGASATAIYKGQMSINIEDDKAYYRSNTGITEILTTSSSSIGKGNYFETISTSASTIDESVEYDEIVYFVAVDSTITLSTAQMARDSIINIKSINKNLTVVSEAGEYIDGESSQTVGPYESIRVKATGDEWYII